MDGWFLIESPIKPEAALSRKVEVGQVWTCDTSGLYGMEFSIYRIEDDWARLSFEGDTDVGYMRIDADGTAKEPEWTRIR